MKRWCSECNNEVTHMHHALSGCCLGYVYEADVPHPQPYDILTTDIPGG